MTTHAILCTGPHDVEHPAPALGELELPDDASDESIERALAGYLCERCGDAYAAAVTDPADPLVDGQLPTRAQLAAYDERAAAEDEAGVTPSRRGAAAPPG